MSVNRQSALVTHERTNFGGSYFDSFTHARMFRDYGPYNFGVKAARLFSQEIGEMQINKKFTYYTIAQKNSFVLTPGTDDYCWYVGNDSETEFRITEYLGLATDMPGKGGLPFRIALDKDWLHTPAVIRLNKGHQLPALRILGQPIQRSANSWEYEVVIQDGAVNSWIPIAELQADRTATRITSYVSDELNQKYAPDQYGDMFKLQSWCSNFGNKAEFTDKFIRMEIGARQAGTKLPSGGVKIDGAKMNGAGAFVNGYVYQVSVQNATEGKLIQRGAFITHVEARLEDRTMMDREMHMQFGRVQKTEDRDSGRAIKIAPGWEQLVLDGHILEHNGSLSLDNIFQFLNGIFLNKRSFTNRKIKFSGGSAAILWLNRLIQAEYATTLTVDSHFVQKNSTPSGYSSNELQYGGQFTKILLPNGIEVSIDYDPMKDDKSIFGAIAPGTDSTIESYALDIFDFGSTEQTASGAKSENITMVMQGGTEEKYQIGNVYNFETGAITDGSNAFSNNKELGLYRAMSGSLCVWDTERIGRIQLNPFI